MVAIFQAERGLIFWLFCVTFIKFKRKSKLDYRIVFFYNFLNERQSYKNHTGADEQAKKYITYKLED